MFRFENVFKSFAVANDEIYDSFNSVSLLCFNYFITLYFLSTVQYFNIKVNVLFTTKWRYFKLNASSQSVSHIVCVVVAVYNNIVMTAVNVNIILENKNLNIAWPYNRGVYTWTWMILCLCLNFIFFLFVSK